jgi:ubiquinone/menaquinone biosynthesis C-methylase UbiE
MESVTQKTPEGFKARLKASYDAMAPTYNAWTVKNSDYRGRYLDKLLALLPKEGVSVLELGCGAGFPVVEKLLATSGISSITASDISTTQINLGKEKLGTDCVTWIESDMMALDFPSASLDAVLGFYSVIHLPREEQSILLTRIFEWLKPGGHMLVNFSAEAMESAINERWLHEEGWMFWSGWGADTSLEEVRKVGLKVVVGEITKDDVDASFLWVIAEKPVV